MPENFYFKKGFSPETIISKLNAARNIKGGIVSFTGLQFNEWFTITYSALNKPRNVNRFQFISAVHAALFNPKLPINFSESQLASECKKALTNLRRRKKKRYTVVFQIVNLLNFKFKTLKIGDAQLYFDMSSRKGFRKAAQKYRKKIHAELGQQDRIPDLKPHHQVLVDVDALSAAEAHQICKEALDTVRGILNLLTNLHRISRMSSGRRKPVNDILEFPFTTIHNRDGSLAYKGFWYTPNWTEPGRHGNFNKHYKYALSNFATVNGFIRRHRLKSDALAAVVQYCDALDEPDWQASFLKIWTLLEFLTQINNADYDKLVKRASKIFGNIAENREVMKHLRIRRNQLVHENSPEEDLEILIYQSKRFAEHLLLFFITNSFKFDRLDDFARFLDSPIEPSERKRAGKILRAANYFWAGAP